MTPSAVVRDFREVIDGEGHRLVFPLSDGAPYYWFGGGGGRSGPYWKQDFEVTLGGDDRPLDGKQMNYYEMGSSNRLPNNMAHNNRAAIKKRYDDEEEMRQGGKQAYRHLPPPNHYPVQFNNKHPQGCIMVPKKMTPHNNNQL